MYGKDECCEVMRLCTDLEIIDMFHEHDVIVTPSKVYLCTINFCELCLLS